ncbi:hypothetical protein [Gandjariella thermophila]|uniref:Peptide zinc metalloprotease protein n=1 Tax=Gandjariella thermophila TaxID=1931992 RepID=A0A4D4J435_9PSEU|nr:hypothetical protein [Gandjariella thermophila]GDY28723.1 hypothetical protein GTS_03560 [Gandjariella thermophila]
MAAGVPSPKHAAIPLDRSGSDVPRLVDGVQLLGEYQGSAYREPRFLAYRPDEQAVLLTPLLYDLLSRIDGRRDLTEIAELVSARHGEPVTADGVRYLIEEKLEPLGLAALHATIDKVPVADPLLSLAARGVLLPARLVRVIARIFAPLHLPPIVIAVLAALLTLDCWMFTSGHADGAIRQTVADPGYMLLTIGLMLVGTLFHEWGHASGCHYGGARPGAIGFGIYVVYPCFYTNVTDAYRLNRAGRLRTDLGGIYFNAVFIVGLGCGYLASGYAPLLAGAILVHGQIIQQLMPTLRMDGYYIVADLVGVPNLFALIGPIVQGLLPRGRRTHPRPQVNLRPFARRVVTAWVLLVIPFLAGGLTLMVLRAPTYIGIAWQATATRWAVIEQAFTHGHIATVLLYTFATTMLWLPWIGLGLLLARILKRATRAVTRRRGQVTEPATA